MDRFGVYRESEYRFLEGVSPECEGWIYVEGNEGSYVRYKVDFRPENWRPYRIDLTEELLINSQR